MISKFRTYLKQASEDILYDKSPYQAGGLECFFGLATRAAVQDGVERDVIAYLLVSNALAVLNEAVDPYNPAVVRANADRIVAIAQYLRKDYDDLDEIKREVLARKEGQG